MTSNKQQRIAFQLVSPGMLQTAPATATVSQEDSDGALIINTSEPQACIFLKLPVINEQDLLQYSPMNPSLRIKICVIKNLPIFFEEGICESAFVSEAVMIFNKLRFGLS